MNATTQNFIRFFVLNCAPQFPRKWRPATRQDVLNFVAKERNIARLDIEAFADKNEKAKVLRFTFSRTGLLSVLDLWLDEFASVSNHTLSELALGGDPFNT